LFLLLLLIIIFIIVIIIIVMIIFYYYCYYYYICTDGSAPIIRYFRGCTFCQGVAPGVFNAVDGMNRMNQRQGPLDMKEKAGEMMEIKV
jgi:hypothetical protein